MLYFAYGSNMSRRQMAERCPSHERLGKALLPDHALCFPRFSTMRNCGVAGIEVRPGGQVWGVVYRLGDADLAALDRREGYDRDKPLHVNRYNRSNVRVLMNGDPTQPADCLTYFARAEPGEHIPSAAYLLAILEGAEENGLPENYLAMLKATRTADSVQ